MYETIEIKIKHLDKNAKTPEKGTAYSSGYDVFSNETIEIYPGETLLVHTGIAVSIPPGYEIQIRPRSGLALHNSIGILNAPGTIDSDYRGEIGVILHNFGKKTFKVKKYDRIAQMVISQVKNINFISVNFLESTERGTGGFGSTDKE